MGQQSLNAVTAPDNYGTYVLNPGLPKAGVVNTYSQVGAIEDVPIERMVLDVVNGSIYWQLKVAAPIGSNTGNWESVETYLIPSSKQIIRPNIVGIRFRAAIPLLSLPAGALQAVVTVNVITP